MLFGLRMHSCRESDLIKIRQCLDVLKARKQKHAEDVEKEACLLKTADAYFEETCFLFRGLGSLFDHPPLHMLMLDFCNLVHST